jgi:FAD binding domain/Berberine and berberine like
MSAVETLGAQIRGDVITPGDATYEAARRVNNGMIDRRPSLIVRCVDAADVVACVNMARENRLPLAVRGGGHNVAGLGTCDGGLVVDLSRMRGVRVDPASRLARVDGGATLGDLDHASHAFGLAAPTGVLSTTGIGGLALHGGTGYLTRRFGLTLDNIEEVDVVTADGRLVVASERDNSDLFWAVRGGGGNFGVVASLVLRLHPVHTVVAGPVLWPIDRSAEVLAFFSDFIATAPETMSGIFAFLSVPPGPPFPEELRRRTMCGVVFCYTGPPDTFETVFAPFRALAPAFTFLVPMPFPVLQTLFDPLYPAGLQQYWRGDNFVELTPAAIAAHVEWGAKLPTPLSSILIYPIDGAVHRVAESATAFADRSARWAQVIVGADPDPANNDAVIGWVKSAWKATHPHGAGGVYLNFTGVEEQDRIRASYRGNYDRLRTVKRAWDPSNLFRVNHNIPPS